jgi:hypothetical protein
MSRKLYAGDIASWPDWKLKAIRDNPRLPYDVRQKASALLAARDTDNIRVANIK